MGTLEGYVEGMINLNGGGGGGTSDYNDLSNKPSINDVTLEGDLNTEDLNISYLDLNDKPYINNMPDSSGASIGDVLTHTTNGDGWYAPIKELPAYTASDNGKVLTIENDNVAWKSVSNRINYSTSEQVIGTWIDGKPIYQRTFVLSTGINLISNGVNLPSSITSELTDVDLFVGAEAVRHTSSLTKAFIAIYVNSDFKVYSADPWSNVNIFTFKYTKTTD